MPQWNRVEKQHVLAAIRDYDRLGDREFLRRFGFGRAKAHTLWQGGNEYDVPAVLGAAYLHATGQAPTRKDLGDEAGAAKVLADLGFDIAVDEIAAEQLRERQAARKTAPAASGTARVKPGEAKASTTQSTRPAAAKPAVKRASRPKPAEPRPVAVCSRCHMALPASGQCDFCE